MASPHNNVTPLHRGGIRILGSVDQALIDGARPFIQPETLDAIYRRRDGLDHARDQYLQDMRHRMNRRAAVLREQRRIGFACLVIAVLTMLYMVGQFARLVLS
jgi:hypothetical protein